MTLKHWLLTSAAIISSASTASAAGLMAGASKADITPPKASLQHGDQIRDRLEVRAIMAKSGSECAILVGVEQGAVRGDVVNAALARATRATGCSKENFVISATHTHSGSTAGLGGGGEPSSVRVEDAIVHAIEQAKASLRPARFGYATTILDLNMNRDLFVDGRWVQGPNPQGHSDKTLSVLEFLDDAGKPIGIYMNYAMHPVNFYLSGLISGDFAGEASRHVESAFKDAVAIFAQGASGDQNPAFQRPQRRLMRARTHSLRGDEGSLTAPMPWAITAQQRNAVNSATEQMNRPIGPQEREGYESAVTTASAMVTATGVLIGEAAIQALANQRRLSTDMVIRGASKAIQCPGRDRLDRDDPVREGALPPYADGAPVDIHVGMLRLGDTYIASVNGEVYSDIAEHLKKASPVSQLMMTTLANGMANSGYIYSNEAAPRLTFQVIGSRLKPGCADDAIVGAELALIEAVRQ